jgi:hypothetical protein
MFLDQSGIGVVDLKQMQLIKRLPTGEKPNGSTYAEPFANVYVSDTNGKQEAVVDVRNDTIVKTLTFDNRDTAIRSRTPEAVRPREIQRTVWNLERPVVGASSVEDAIIRLLDR